MKLEVEITEDEIRSAIERKIRVAIANEGSGWEAGERIKKMVKEAWSAAADKIVADAFANSSGIRRRVEAEIERKITAKLNAVVRQAGK